MGNTVANNRYLLHSTEQVECSRGYALSFMIVASIVFALLPIAPHVAGQGTDKEAIIEQSFPDVVDKMKRSIASVGVRTNVDSIEKRGTAFLIYLAADHGLLATCRHTLLKPSMHKDMRVIPDTSRIYVTFHEHEEVFKAQVLVDQEERDIAIICIELKQAKADSLELLPVNLAKAREIRDGLDIGCTGYDLTQKTKRFDKTYLWLTTHRGVVSCTFAIGPTQGEEFIDHFQADMLVNKGASGSPVYKAGDGRVIGMCQGFKGKEKEGLLVNHGLANCVPIWAVYKLLIDWVELHRSPDTTKITQEAEVNNSR
ncbi:MAG: trypsin-like peptidase domain-containing protein [candidate division Zixibacteria bacterium]|nr:trypsin-like peptidase domain-containing protein [candidate division Zixibacteria bacterium]